AVESSTSAAVARRQAGTLNGREAAMRRILVVDDDPHVGRAIQGWLRDHGFQVQLADSSADGLTALDRFGVDLMIVDVPMPDISCFESIRLFHARAPAVPLIAIS